MKRKYRLIGMVCGFVLIIAILVFGVSQWNQNIAKTTEQAKDDLNMAEQAKDDPTLNSDSSKDEDQSTSKKNNPKSGPEQSDPEQSGSVELDPSTDPKIDPRTDPKTDSKIDSKEQSESVNGNENSGSQDVDVKLPSHTSHTLTEIKTAYRDAFTDLEVQQTSDMDQLLVQAKADYVSGKLSKADLAVRYQAEATTLESNTDQLFNALYQQMQTDLEKNGHSANEAIEFRNEYQAKKQERLTHVISQIQNF